jgi:hypothetical protein
LAHEHIVNCEPDLGLNFAKLSLLMSFNFDPSLIFKFLVLTFAVLADPRLLLKKGYQN